MRTGLPSVVLMDLGGCWRPLTATLFPLRHICSGSHPPLPSTTSHFPNPYVVWWQSHAALQAQLPHQSKQIKTQPWQCTNSITRFYLHIYLFCTLCSQIDAWLFLQARRRVRLHVAFVSISFGEKTREIHFTRCRRGIISWELLKLGSHFDVVEHILWKLAGFSLRQWRIHGAAKIRNIRNGAVEECCCVSGPGLHWVENSQHTGGQTHMWEDEDRKKKRKDRTGEREMDRYGCVAIRISACAPFIWQQIKETCHI